MRSRSHYYRADGKLLVLTRLEKILYPGTGFKKKDLLNYYRRIAPSVLPHLRNRPFTLYRFPDGVRAPGFYEKQCPSHRPPWIATAELGGVRYCLVNDRPSLLWISNLAAIELHTTLATTADLTCPTSIVFDLDPGESCGARECAEVALLVRSRLERLGLESFAKTSGRKGIHIHLPLNAPTGYDETKPFAKGIAERLEAGHPDLVVSKMAKSLRKGKVFIDWSQNTDFKTTATAYSLRVGESPSVSLPLSWSEVRAMARGSPGALGLATPSPEQALRRVSRLGDLFAPLLNLKQDPRRIHESPENLARPSHPARRVGHLGHKPAA